MVRYYTWISAPSQSTHSICVHRLSQSQAGAYNGGTMNTTEALQQLDLAHTAGKITPAAEKNIRIWLTAPYLTEYAPAVVEHIAAGKWHDLEDVFWTTIPFG